MRMILTALTLAAGFGLTTAAAQGTGSAGATPSAGQVTGTSQSGTAGAESGASNAAAPVGHRQPRAAHLPADTSSESASGGRGRDSRDAALDRALRSICRGC
jgi:hypothetical protein